MSHKIGFRLGNNKAERRKKHRKPGAIMEYVESEDAELRLAGAFEMLLRVDVPATVNPNTRVEPKPGTQLPLF